MSGVQRTEISDRIIAERKRQRLTQKTLAQKAAIPRPTLSNIERGATTPSGWTADALARALSVSTDWLMSGILPKSRAEAEGVTPQEQAMLRSYRQASGALQQAIQVILREHQLAKVEGAMAPLTTNEYGHQVQQISPQISVMAPFAANTNLRKVRLWGEVACGGPIAAIRTDEDVDVPADLLGEGRFVVRARGDSMVGRGIEDRALVVCSDAKGYKWDRDDIVVAEIDGIEREATLKTYVRSKGKTVYLAPASPDHDVQAYSPGTWEITGRALWYCNPGGQWTEVKRGTKG